MQSIRYVSHARTLEDLRDEFLSDLQRRLDSWDKHLKVMQPGASESARIAKARMELLDLQDYWRQIELRGRDEERNPSI